MPFLVANVIEILDVDPEDLGVEEDGAHVDLDSQRKGTYICRFGERGKKVFLQRIFSPILTLNFILITFREMCCYQNFD